tara:strand:+ start:1112 stop:1246 length:135 start_codon:yes stop_codon:yes gene_type:complete
MRQKSKICSLKAYAKWKIKREKVWTETYYRYRKRLKEEGRKKVG